MISRFIAQALWDYPPLPPSIGMTALGIAHKNENKNKADRPTLKNSCPWDEDHEIYLVSSNEDSNKPKFILHMCSFWNASIIQSTCSDQKIVNFVQERWPYRSLSIFRKNTTQAQIFEICLI